MNGYLINLLYDATQNDEINDFIDRYHNKVLSHYDGVVVCLNGYDSDELDEAAKKLQIDCQYLDAIEAQGMGIEFSEVDDSGDYIYFSGVIA